MSPLGMYANPKNVKSLNFKKVRTFGGKKFTLFSTVDYMKKANDIVEAKERQGYQVEVPWVLGPDGRKYYPIYIRKERKKK